MTGIRTFLAVTALGTTLGVSTLIWLDRQEPKEDPWESAHIVILDPGGSVMTRWAEYLLFETDDDFRLRIEGPCASACTFFLGNVSLDKVCYGDNANLGFHGAWAMGEGYLPDFTEFILRHVYPHEVSTWLRTRWDPSEQVNDPVNLDLIWTSPATFGIQHCEDVL